MFKSVLSLVHNVQSLKKRTVKNNFWQRMSQNPPFLDIYNNVYRDKKPSIVSFKVKAGSTLIDFKCIQKPGQNHNEICT